MLAHVLVELLYLALLVLVMLHLPVVEVPDSLLALLGLLLLGCVSGVIRLGKKRYAFGCMPMGV